VFQVAKTTVGKGILGGANPPPIFGGIPPPKNFSPGHFSGDITTRFFPQHLFEKGKPPCGICAQRETLDPLLSLGPANLPLKISPVGSTNLPRSQTIPKGEIKGEKES